MGVVTDAGARISRAAGVPPSDRHAPGEPPSEPLGDPAPDHAVSAHDEEITGS
jgi:hypothetical protein